MNIDPEEPDEENHYLDRKILAERFRLQQLAYEHMRDEQSHPEDDSVDYDD